MDPTALAARPKCPHAGCQKPLSGVQRYGRITNAVNVLEAERKFLMQMENKTAQVHKDCEHAREQVRKLVQLFADRTTRPSHRSGTVRKQQKQVLDLARKAEQHSGACRDEAPLLKLLQLEQAARQLLPAARHSQARHLTAPSAQVSVLFNQLQCVSLIFGVLKR